MKMRHKKFADLLNMVVIVKTNLKLRFKGLSPSSDYFLDRIGIFIFQMP